MTFASGCAIVCQLEVTQWLTPEGVQIQLRAEPHNGDHFAPAL